MRLLCTGDIHLGRNPTRIPTERIPDQRQFSTRVIWERIVDLAIEERVDALLVSGDLVDHDNRFFESLGPVETGIERLKAAGVPVFAVAGNHDYDVLPRLADRYGDAFRLIGRNQQWERVPVLDGNGQPRLYVDGWSFSAQHVRTAPLSTYSFGPADGLPVIGLLHTDLDKPTSTYAPSRLSELRAAPVAAWLIGHVHALALHEEIGAPPVLYPGSPQPLDPGEPGDHGVWMLDIDSAGRAGFSFRPFATVRYQRIDVDLSGVTESNEAGQRVFDRINDDARAIQDRLAASPPAHILYRVDLTGRNSLGEGRHAEFASFNQLANDPWAIERIEDRTRPEIELSTLSRESSPAGVIARLLQSLDEDEPSPLLVRARAEMESVRSTIHYQPLNDEQLPPPRELFEETAWELLEALVSNRGGEA